MSLNSDEKDVRDIDLNALPPTINRDWTWNPQQTRAEVAESAKLASQLTVGRMEFGPSLNPPPSNSGVASNIKAMASEFYRPAHAPEVKRGTLVIGFVGAAGAGKDTVVAHLIEKFGCAKGQDGIDLRCYALADTLKIEVYDWLAIAQGLFQADLKPVDVPGGVWPQIDHPRTYQQKLDWINDNKGYLRELLQKWGTELRRSRDASYWVDKLLERIRTERPQIAALTDVRFKNEVALCHVTVRVNKLGAMVDPKTAAHVSESELAHYPCDHTISAEAGDLISLQASAECVFERILEKFRVQ